MNKVYTFFAAISRMKYIERWSQMRNSRQENDSEHAMEVAMIAHALCTIGNVRFGKSLDNKSAALIGLYHDATEIVTGDMPTPVKYHNAQILDAFKEVEKEAASKLISKLPFDMQSEYEYIFNPGDSEDEIYMRRLVKAADKLSAYIKCIEEKRSGNREFDTAIESIKIIIDNLSKELPEVKVFVEEFLPAYGKTLDELLL